MQLAEPGSSHYHSEVFESSWLEVTVESLLKVDMKNTLNVMLKQAAILAVLSGISHGHAASLVAHFPLDSDGNSADGNFVASDEMDVEYGGAGANGNTGTSAYFNGASSVIHHDWSSDLNPESFTLAFWARSEGGSGTWNSPVTSRHDLNAEGQTSQGYLVYDSNPTGSWTFWSGNGSDPGNWQTLDGPEVLLGEWQHVAITYDNLLKTKKLFVDGELVAESNDSLTPNDTTPFNIGAGQDFGDGFWFLGDLDDIGLWDGALSGNDIQSVMNDGVASFQPENPDRDGDGILNEHEAQFGLDPDVADSDSDKDGDGLTAIVEITELGTDPTKADTDEDGLNDKAESNTGVYVDASNTGTNPLVADTDGDGLTDGEEVSSDGPGTHPLKSDTDGDGFADNTEIQNGTDPLDKTSKPSPLVAFWPLDDGGESADGKYVPVEDLAFYGDPGARDFTGTSAYLDGESVIQFEHTPDLNPPSFTLSLWANSEGGAGTWNSPLTSRDEQGNPPTGYLIYDSNPSGSWTFWSGSGGGGWQTLDGPEVNLGAWDHVTISYDDATQTKKLYVNGALVSEGNSKITPNNSTPFNIGAGQDFGDGFHFIGNIDDIALFRVPLSDGDIAFIYENGVQALLDKGIEEPQTAGSVQSIALSDGSVVIEFEGALKSSDSVSGPYTEVDGASSPYTVQPDGSAKFFIAE